MWTPHSWRMSLSTCLVAVAVVLHVVAALPGGNVSDIEWARDQCVYRGRIYKNGEKLEQLQEDNPCRIGCTCFVFEGVASLQCAQIQCPIYNNPESRKPGCVFTKKLNQCCPSDVKCPEESGLFNDADIVCRYKDRTYVEGQYIDDIEDPCTTCLCVPGFTGPDGPGCKKIHCVEVPSPHPECKPVFQKEFCCPVKYDCPEGLNHDLS